MPKAYSLDLRERVARFVGSGRSRHAAAAHFKVSVSFVVNLMKAYRMTGSLEPTRSASGVSAGRVAERDDITMPELAAELAAATGTRADPASISRWLIRNGYRRALRRRRSDEPPHLRDLCRDPARADPRKGRCRHHGQLVSPQKPGRREGHKGQGHRDPLPAALQPRPQSDRDGLRKTQPSGPSTP